MLADKLMTAGQMVTQIHCEDAASDLYQWRDFGVPILKTDLFCVVTSDGVRHQP